MSVKTNDRPTIKNKLREFFVAIQNGDCKQVQKILRSKDVNVNDSNPLDPMQPTAIIAASQLQNLEMVDLLMSNKPKPANVNAETTTGRRALWWAVTYKNVQLTRLLLSAKNCDVNYIDKETGCTPLYRAISLDSSDIAKELLHAGADVNKKLTFGSGKVSPLIKAIQMNNLESCQLLINNLCSINAQTDDGHSALHFAVFYRCYDICELLLQNGAKVNAKSKNGVTAMTLAIISHDPCMARLLLHHGYKSDRLYSWKEAPLHQAIKLHSHVCALTLLHWGCSLKPRCKKISYFQMAVNEKLWDVALLIVHLQPMLLQEKWLKEEKWPVSVYQDQAKQQLLVQLSMNVFSLKELCRAKVLQCLGSMAPRKVAKLPLPPSLINYLLLKEFFKDNFYDPIPFDSLRCPYECPIICSKWDCFPLDISVSSDSD